MQRSIAVGASTDTGMTLLEHADLHPLDCSLLKIVAESVFQELTYEGQSLRIFLKQDVNQSKPSVSNALDNSVVKSSAIPSSRPLISTNGEPSPLVPRWAISIPSSMLVSVIVAVARKSEASCLESDFIRLFRLIATD